MSRLTFRGGPFIPGARLLFLGVILLATAGISGKVDPLGGGQRTGQPGLESRVRDVVLLPDPAGRVVALTLAFPIGSGLDPRGSEGMAHLLGRSLERTTTERVSRQGGRVEVLVTTDHLLLTLLTPAHQWQQGWAELRRVLWNETISSSLLESVRAEILDRLRFEAGAPGRGFEGERALLIRGSTHPQARPTRGSEGTVLALTAEALEVFRREHLSETTALVVLMGPISVGEVEEVFGGVVRTPVPTPSIPPPAGLLSALPAESLRAVNLPDPALRLPLSAEIPTEGRMAWTEGARTLLDRELTSTWMSVAYPFPAGTPSTLLHFLGHLVVEALSPTPPDPGLYEAATELLQVDGAPVLLISASVDPRITSSWESRLTRAIPELAGEPPVGAFFELSRRRFRSQLLLQLAPPERRTAWVAAELLRDPWGLIDLDLEVWRLDREAVSTVAGRAGSPRILLYGPESMMDR